MHHKFVIYPFAAIVGQNLMKEALLVNAVDPSVGGVLIKGDKGTGKSTAVRALADLLGEIRVVKDCPFQCHPENKRLMCLSCQERAKQENKDHLPYILKKMEIIDMPLSATEDMVVGSINIKQVLKDGVKRLEPGLLARANRNVLYIDEVNLLDDHLTNILLDAAAMGVNVVEREGISVYHPARFILIGTMNPEEGELRPQIIDRFGLSVEVHALSDTQQRLKVLTNRMRFDKDPYAFEQEFINEQSRLKEAVFKARDILPQTTLSKKMLLDIVKLTSALSIKTHRADIVMDKTARVLAALKGRKKVIHEDIVKAAFLALSHRMRQDPLRQGEMLTKQKIEEIFTTENDKSKLSQKRNEDAGQVEPLSREGALKSEPVSFDKSIGSYGRVTKESESSRGHYVKARPNRDPKSIAINPTLKRAIIQTGTLNISTEHLMEKVRYQKGKALYILLIDTSSSMRMNQKIKLAKTLSWQLLQKSYQKKNFICLIAFRGEKARTLVPPTQDAARVDNALQALPTGGKTPLTPALFEAMAIAGTVKEARPVIIVISDGKANVYKGESFQNDIDVLKTKLGSKADLVFINTESPGRSLGILEQMAKTFNAGHFYLEDLLYSKEEIK